MTGTTPDEFVKYGFMQCVAFHHAGLLLEERKLIEKGLRQGILNNVVATTTLSAGISIMSVSTVIIENVSRTEDRRRKVGLPSS
jgi:replicative superfamily II helicase